MSDLDGALGWTHDVDQLFRKKKLNLNNTPESKNFVDRTGRSDIQRWRDYLLANLNPVTAYQKVRDNVSIPLRLMDRQMPESKNFVDKRNLITPQYDWKNALFWELMNRNYNDGRRGDGSYTLRDPKSYPKPYVVK